MAESLITGILDNDHNAISRAISSLKQGETINRDFYNEIYDHANQAFRIGITGPPGCGKSTIVSALIDRYLLNKRSVGVVAVDPTSPFTGGAILGDRVRMNRYAGNDSVFIRSIGSHGALGGLSRMAQETGDILAASGKDIVIFETVGVGQAEHDIVKVADLVIVLLVPESGDQIQLMKAGLIEIADLFAVNKSDREGAGRLAHLLKNTLHSFSTNRELEPPVYTTIATKEDGIPEMYDGITALIDTMVFDGTLKKRRLERYRERVSDLVRHQLESEFWTIDRKEVLNMSTATIESLDVSPTDMANRLVQGQIDG